MQGSKDRTGLDPVFLQVSLKSYYIVRLYAEEPFPFSGEGVCVSLCVSEPQPEQMIEPLKLRQPNSRLHIGHAVIDPRHRVPVVLVESTVSIIFRIPEITAEHSSFSCGDCFVPVEAIGGELAPYRNHTQGLAGVFNYWNPKLAEITRIDSVEVNGENCSCLSGKDTQEPVFIQTPSCGVNINKHWPCSHGENCGSRRSERKRRNDDFVPRPNSKSDEGKMERTRAATGCNAGSFKPSAEGFFKGTFKSPGVGDIACFNALRNVFEFVAS